MATNFCWRANGRSKSQQQHPYPVSRLGITGRVGVLLVATVLLPLILTSWLIETGHLLPGQNFYFATPLLLLILLRPFSRVAAYWLINRDLEAVNRFCTEIKKGNYTVSFALGNEKEEENQFLILLRNLNWMNRGLAAKERNNNSRFHSVRQQYNAMAAQARTDSLTGLYNRRHFDKLLLGKAEKAALSKAPVSLIFLDCDKFKNVNDSMGHEMGDLALMRLADSIQNSIRSNNDIPFRFGGDEFAVLLPNTKVDQAVEVASRIRSLYMDCRVGETTLSIGVAMSFFSKEKWREQARNLVRSADQKTYLVKKRGGDGICLAESYDQAPPA